MVGTKPIRKSRNKIDSMAKENLEISQKTSIISIATPYFCIQNLLKLLFDSYGELNIIFIKARFMKKVFGIRLVTLQPD